MNVIRGRVTDIVFKHDASRIVQSVVKYGGQKERDEIAAELKGKYKELAQNKYSKVRRPCNHFRMFWFTRSAVLSDKTHTVVPNTSNEYPPRIPIARSPNASPS